jgi:hypothetical protein
MAKEILATEPDNLQVLVDLGANAYLLPPLKNPTLTAEGLGYAQKALQMLESGKTLETWDPLGSKDVAIAYLNYSIGALTLEKDPGGTLKNLLKAAQFETPLKKSPYTYAYIAGAYETGPYAKQSEEYKRLYFGKDETPESKLALANINQLIDRMIDAYARAVALAGSDASFAAAKTCEEPPPATTAATTATTAPPTTTTAPPPTTTAPTTTTTPTPPPTETLPPGTNLASVFSNAAPGSVYSLADDDLFEVRRRRLDLFDFDAAEGDRIGEGIRIEIGIDESSQPVFGELHVNCFRKRKSFSKNNRRSLTP